MTESLRIFRPALGGVLLFALAATAAEQPPTSQIPVAVPETRVRTKEDVERGKRNAVSVAEQLEELFQRMPAPRKMKLKEIPPYFRIIPLPAGKSNDLLGGRGAEDRATLVYQCRYNTARKLLNGIDAMVENGMAEEAPERNMLIVTDSARNVEAIKDALLVMDVASPQVLIEARVVEVLVGDGMQRNLSVSFNQESTGIGPGGLPIPVKSTTGFNTSTLGQSNSDIGGTLDWVFETGSGSNIHATFQWLRNANDARILSSPNILVTRNEVAKISTGQDVPIQELTNSSGNVTTSTTFKRVGVTLKVTPLMLNEDSVVLRVEPEVSNIQSYQRIYQASGSYDVPVISIRNMDTHLKMGDGQIVLMGGLYSNAETTQQERIPFLSDLPYLGELFTSKNYTKEVTQLIFILRTRILQPDEVADGVIFDPNLMAEESNALGEILRNSPSLPKLPDTTLEEVKREFIDEPEKRDSANSLPLTPPAKATTKPEASPAP